MLDYLDKLPDTTPQLILLDIDLGSSVNGLDLIPELHRRLKGRAPIIMFSSSSEPPAIKQAYAKGAVAYTQKPDDLQGWKNYVASLRSYWHNTTVLPTRG